jgi:hypothetical protein
MNEIDFEIWGAWRSVVDGQEYEAVAKTKRSKRVIARATGHLSLDTEDALDRTFGEAGRAAVEASINDACKQLALRFPG